MNENEFATGSVPVMVQRQESWYSADRSTESCY